MEFERVGDIVRGVRVHQGLEVDFSPRFESKVAEFVNKAQWDILLCSVHEFQKTGDIEKSSGPTSKHSPYSRWREYIELQRRALESDFLPYHILAHPVRLSRGLDPHPADMEDLLLELASTARSNGRALELNGKDLDYAPDLVRILAVACSKAGCKVSLGSDAHYPSEVFQNMETAQKLVDEYKLELFIPDTHY